MQLTSRSTATMKLLRLLGAGLLLLVRAPILGGNEAGTGWSHLGASPPDGGGIWYQAIQGANTSHVYSAYVTYDVITSATCSYAANNAQNWCP